MAISLRTKKCTERYKEAIQNGELEICPLCTTEAITKFSYWKLIRNKFPYDAIAEEHDMLIPLRHCIEADLSIEEINELSYIKKTALHDRYDYLLEGLGGNLSIPNHIHIHLLKLK